MTRRLLREKIKIASKRIISRKASEALTLFFLFVSTLIGIYDYFDNKSEDSAQFVFKAVKNNGVRNTYDILITNIKENITPNFKTESFYFLKPCIKNKAEYSATINLDIFSNSLETESYFNFILKGIPHNSTIAKRILEHTSLQTKALEQRSCLKTEHIIKISYTDEYNESKVSYYKLNSRLKEGNINYSKLEEEAGRSYEKSYYDNKHREQEISLDMINRRTLRNKSNGFDNKEFITNTLNEILKISTQPTT